MRLALLTVSVFLASCGSTQAFDPSTPASRAEANAALADRGAVLVLADGQRVRTRTLRFDGDGASWIDATGAAQMASYDEVTLVHLPQRRALVGLGVGTAVGLGLGALAAADGGGAPLFTPATLVTTLALGGAVVGSAVGYVAGSVGDVYEPVPPSP